MAKRRITINTNPNQNPAPGQRNPSESGEWESIMNEMYEKERAENAGKEYEKPATRIKKINSNPVPGKTRIGPLAGGGASGMFGTKNR